MAKAAKVVSKLSDKLAQVNENFTINMYDNGYMIEVGGRDSKDEWANCKILVTSLEELIVLITEASNMPRC